MARSLLLFCMASRTSNDVAKMINWGFGVSDKWMYPFYGILLISLPAAHVAGYSYVSYMLLTFFVGLVTGRMTAV